MKKRDQQQGSVVIFVALALFALLGLVALVLDSSKLTITKEQAYDYTRLVSLAATEAYFSSDKPSVEMRLNDALTRAKQVSLPNRFLSEKTGEKLELGLALTPDTKFDGPLLQPGRWNFKNCDEANPDTSVDKKRCFEPWYVGASFDPNAFRVKGVFHRARGGYLADLIFGNRHPETGATTIASAIPRHGCFLVDISASLVRQSYRYWLSTEVIDSPVTTTGQITKTLQCKAAPGVGEPHALGSEFAFFVQPPATVSTHTCSWNYFSNKCAAPGSCLNPPSKDYHNPKDYVSRFLFTDADYSEYGKAISRFGDIKSLHPDPTFKGDPAKNELNETVFAIADPRPQEYRIDMFRGKRNGPNGEINYEGGPAPLSTIFNALNNAMNLFTNRKVGGDKACIIFFDNVIEWPRVIKLTDRFDYLKRITSAFSKAPVNPEKDPKTIEEARTQANFYTADDMNIIARMGFFPKVNRQSDYQGAIRTAMSFLLNEQDKTKIESKDFLVVIGDWLHNCVSNADVPAGQTVGCDNTLDKYLGAMRQLNKFIDEDVAPPTVTNGIPIHTILVGSHVAPHMVEYPRPGTPYCMTDKEMRKKVGDYPAVVNLTDRPTLERMWRDMYLVPDANSVNRATRFFPGALNARRIAEKTRGIWGPLRFPSLPGIAACTGDRYGDGRKSVPCTMTPGRADVYVDFDPFCRSQEDQAKDFMKEILEGYPYKIVYAEN